MTQKVGLVVAIEGLLNLAHLMVGKSKSRVGLSLIRVDGEAFVIELNRCWVILELTEAVGHIEKDGLVSYRVFIFAEIKRLVEVMFCLFIAEHLVVLLKFNVLLITCNSHFVEDKWVIVANIKS